MATITNTPSRDWESAEAGAEWEAIRQAATARQHADHLANEKARAAIRGLVLASIHQTNMRALAASRSAKNHSGRSGNGAGEPQNRRSGISPRNHVSSSRAESSPTPVAGTTESPDSATGNNNVTGETSSATARATKSSGVTRRSLDSMRRTPTALIDQLAASAKRSESCL